MEVKGNQWDPWAVERGCQTSFCEARVRSSNHKGGGLVTGEWANQAVEKGAVAIVTRGILQDYEGTVPLLTVPDMEEAEVKLSHAFYDDPSQRMTVVGVMGGPRVCPSCLHRTCSHRVIHAHKALEVVAPITFQHMHACIQYLVLCVECELCPRLSTLFLEPA